MIVRPAERSSGGWTKVETKQQAASLSVLVAPAVAGGAGTAIALAHASFVAAGKSGERRGEL